MITLNSNEHILLVRRKHWFVLLAKSFPVVFLLVLPIIIWIAVSSLNFPKETFPGYFLNDALKINTALILFGLSWWTLMVWIKFFVVWTDYYLDAWIITNKRIIDVEQIGFFRREVSTFRFEQIQDITVDIRGLIPTLLNFGTLHVQTAGEERKLLIKNVASPNDLRDFISRKHDEMHGHKKIESV
jgi:hypothetical protein